MNAFVSAKAQELTPFEHSLIRRKAGQILGRNGFAWQDRDSVEQELKIKLLERLEFFDRGVSHRNVFATTVIEREVAKLIRYRQADKRDFRRVCSLNVMIPSGDEDPVELGSTISTQEYETRWCRESRSPEALSELRQDITTMLELLPPDLRRLAEQLKEKSLSQVAREMGIPRTTLRERVYEIRARFESAGMRFHL